MSGRIQWPFEPICDVPAFAVTCSGQSLCSQTAAPSRTTDEEQFRVFRHTTIFEMVRQPISERRINPIVRKCLPLDRQHLLSKGRKIRKTDKRPFCSCPHIDKNGVRIIPQSRPGVLYRNV